MGGRCLALTVVYGNQFGERSKKYCDLVTTVLVGTVILIFIQDAIGKTNELSLCRTGSYNKLNPLLIKWIRTTGSNFKGLIQS